MDFNVDYVFPYVNGSDPEWIRRHDNFCCTVGRIDQLHKPERFRDFGFLRYMFRGLAYNAPWLNKVYMIVESESQVPEWVNRDTVQVILHKDIMPEMILPTYNSSTIEMFLDKIPGLSEHFIYGNDDMYLTRSTLVTDWFKDERTVRVNWNTFQTSDANTMFRKMCAGQWCELMSLFHRVSSLRTFTYKRPSHGQSPMLFSDVHKTRLLMKSTIDAHLEPFRNSQQHNQYIYNIFSDIVGHSCASAREFKYIETKHTPEYVANTIRERHMCLCLNDVSSANMQDWTLRGHTVIKAFEELFPEPCKYEKEG